MCLLDKHIHPHILDLSQAFSNQYTGIPFLLDTLSNQLINPCLNLVDTFPLDILLGMNGVQPERLGSNDLTNKNCNWRLSLEHHFLHKYQLHK
jgi:hypothetical protein